MSFLDKYKIKEEEEKPFSFLDKYKFTAEVNMGAKVVGGATEDTSLHLVRNPYLVKINDLKSELEKSGTILDDYDNDLTKLDEQFKINPTQKLANQYNSILNKRRTLFKEYETKGNQLDNLIDEYNKTVKIKNEQIDVRYKQAFKHLQYGYSSALSIIVMAILVILTIFIVKNLIVKEGNL